MKRRNLLQATTGIALASLASAPGYATEEQPQEGEGFLLQDGQTVLFQGDSITDALRDKEKPESLGNGYAALLAPWISAAYPSVKLNFINRGISGNRVVDLQERWEKDCLDLKPNWLSILIGVNDTWRRYDKNDPTSAEDFEKGYRKLLDRVHENLQAQIILLEPFLLHVSEKVEGMREDLDPKREVVRRVSEEYNTLFIPTDDLFREACGHREPAFWAKDGVHPTPAGHALIAQAWLKSVGF